VSPGVPRQLARLTRAVPGAGPTAQAIAVYAEAPRPGTGLPHSPRVARERGFEGVACVDDAARAVVLYCAAWRRWHHAATRMAAERLLRFLAHMQDAEGRFCNFILDWAGDRNGAGQTSAPGGAPWQARGLHALACGVAVFGGQEWDQRFTRALPWIDARMPYLDVRAVGVLALLEHWRATGSGASAERALAWSEKIAGHTSGDGSLLNAEGVQAIHLWGHVQEAALAQAGQAFGRADLVDCARASAEALLVPAVASGFDAAHVLPFDVSCTIAGLTAVGRATGEARYAEAAALGQAWFRGRNSARRPVHDVRRGLFYDGIDAGRVNRNSGAESNIEGALALLSTSAG
jgi:hypothetical protein